MPDALTRTKDRPAKEPGGCECMTCGAIFVGAEWHTQCGICYERTLDLKHEREAVASLPASDEG